MAREALPSNVLQRLALETQEIVGSTDPVSAASVRYDSARTAVWFKPVLSALARMSGLGQRCMFCSGSEAGQVEHYRPKATYFDQALCWENFLWICGVCNIAKGSRFDEACPPINPIDDQVWDFFFIDEFGALSARWNDTAGDLEPRAVKTIDLLSLDRQALQESRFERLKDLRAKAVDSIELFRQNHLSQDEIEIRLIEWFEQPFQPDVADYFFAGPGANNKTEPFRQLFDIIGG